MNREALTLTREHKRVVYWSRSRRRRFFRVLNDGNWQIDEEIIKNPREIYQ